MENIKDIVRTFEKPLAKRGSERGELLEYFHRNVNAGRDGKKYKKLSMGYIATRLTGLELKDLYYIKSVCQLEQRRGQPFGKIFFGMLKPRNDV